MFQVECEAARSRETGEQVQARGGAEPRSLLAEPFAYRVWGRMSGGAGSGVSESEAVSRGHSTKDLVSCV